MKNAFLIMVKFSVSAIFIFLLAAPVSAQKNIYFDKNGKEISKAKYKKESRTPGYLDVNEEKDGVVNNLIIWREEEGNVGSNGLKILREYLQKCSGEKINPDEIITIKYYPGKDPCNSSGRASVDRNWVKYTNNNLQDSIEQLSNVRLMYICKSMEGLELHKNNVPWHLDIDHGVEELFFKHHYPCSSFVVINTDGSYYAFFGEHSNNQITSIAKIFHKKIQARIKN